MKQAGKHAWGTPKCGISLTLNVWQTVKVEKDYSFLLARHPYNRIVSLFAEKVVDVNGNLAKKYNLELCDFVKRERAAEKQLRGYCNLDSVTPVRDLTFKWFCLNIRKESVDSGEDHIKKQCFGAPEKPFDDIIWVEDLPECFNIPAEKLGVDINTSKEELEKSGGPPHAPSHFTPRSDELNTLDQPWNIPVLQWWEHKAFPYDYYTLFDNEIKECIYNLYIDDFKYFGLTK